MAAINGNPITQEQAEQSRAEPVNNGVAMPGAANVPGPESASDIEAFLTGESQAGYQLEADMKAFPSGVGMGGDFAVNAGPQTDAMIGLDSDGTPFFAGEDQDHLSGPDNQRGMDAMQGLAAHGGSFEVVYVNDQMHIQPVSDLGIPASDQADSEVN